MDQIAIKESWKNYPIDNPKTIKLKLIFNEEQFLKIQNGLIPVEMEDKWFIYYEDGWLYFHRSWTGFGLYKAQLLQKDNFYVISEFYAERNKEKYINDDDNQDINSLLLLICTGLLSIDPAEFLLGDSKKNNFFREWSDFG